MLHTRADVVRCLLTYTDWVQPATTSVLQVAAARREKNVPDGFRAGLLETLDERTELCRRMQIVDERDRQLLFLWYVAQLSAQDIARALRISRRQCFRLRARAIQKIVELGEPGQAA